VSKTPIARQPQQTAIERSIVWRVLTRAYQGSKLENPDETFGQETQGLKPAPMATMSRLATLPPTEPRKRSVNGH
jgi:hypothetical protein